MPPLSRSSPMLVSLRKRIPLALQVLGVSTAATFALASLLGFFENPILSMMFLLGGISSGVVVFGVGILVENSEVQRRAAVQSSRDITAASQRLQSASSAIERAMAQPASSDAVSEAPGA